MASLQTELQRIYDHHGKLQPKLVVDAARKKSHPLHTHFEWDDSVAGEKYRIEQARKLIQKVRIRYQKTPRSKVQSVRKFVSVEQSDGPPSYTPVEDVAKDELMASVVLQSMEREWRQLKAKYSHMVEFIEMVTADVESGSLVEY